MSDLTGELIDNRYLLQRRLAAGGMATIYAGIDTRLDRPVAVKIMHAHLANDEAFVSRFIKEAKATAALSHPNIVSIQDQGWNEGGIAKQRWSVSDTAEYGDYVSGPRVIDPSVKENMKKVLADVQSGAFAKRFIDDQDAGAPEFKALRAKGEVHPIEQVGRDLRKMMSWVKSANNDDYKEGNVARG